MKSNLYAIRDNLAEVFHKPFVEVNEYTAIRAFSETAKSQPHKDDYSLYHIGEWIDHTGELIPLSEPKRIFSGMDVTADMELVQPAHLSEQAI